VARAFSAAGASQGDRASMPDDGGFFSGDAFGLYHGARKAGVCSLPRASSGLPSIAYECSANSIRNVRTGESIALLGIPETGGTGTIGCECSRHDGFHIWEDCVYAEIVDGELVVTTLCLEAQPLIRYRTGLKARFVSRERCLCGRTSPRIEILGDARS
jgi:phenylacetate-coenzyme A ligase PaaK-like adenylate-forming protein